MLREESLSTKILRTQVNSEVVQGMWRWTVTRRAGVQCPPRFDFKSAHYTKVAVANLLKMIFRVFSFSCLAIDGMDSKFR